MDALKKGKEGRGLCPLLPATVTMLCLFFPHTCV